MVSFLSLSDQIDEGFKVPEPAWHTSKWRSRCIRLLKNDRARVQLFEKLLYVPKPKNDERHIFDWSVELCQIVL
jgi:hypothetical protein